MDFFSTSFPLDDPLSSIFVPNAHTSDALHHSTNVGKDTQPQHSVGSSIPTYVEGSNNQATWNDDLFSAHGATIDHGVHNGGLIHSDQLANPMSGPWNSYNIVDTPLRPYNGGVHFAHHDQAFGNSSMTFGDGAAPASTSRESSVSYSSSGSSDSTPSLMTPHWNQAPSLQTPFLQQHALFMSTPIPDVQQPQMANSFMGYNTAGTQLAAPVPPAQIQNFPELQFRYYTRENTLNDVSLSEPSAATSSAISVDNSSPIPSTSTSATPASQPAGPSSAREKIDTKGKGKVDDSKKTDNIGPIRPNKRTSKNSKVPCKISDCKKLFHCKKTMLRHVRTWHEKQIWYCPGLDAVRDSTMQKCNHVSGYVREDSLKRHLGTAKENDPCRIEASNLGWDPTVPGSIQKLKEYRPSCLNGELAENM
ncbi:uncharacterized protein FOMMEDRAFT_30276 [Fomitiporia mediterranea MF3/22]|uniref:uncharacterized protein n=1 Tax=Fomitiporia mediterranea (strain MF3/22) TaxID=694068 RepID=UPI00044093E6|nr:uncharacterized protein FOMMEDRAFT_30276 [Fomitiporia mediterranea MF3/22]EJD01633.1 hypothetical protein FOMMEDRAFT_30276 [Fomitiporia mediterranea MF3/22]